MKIADFTGKREKTEGGGEDVRDQRHPQHLQDRTTLKQLTQGLRAMPEGSIGGEQEGRAWIHHAGACSLRENRTGLP